MVTVESQPPAGLCVATTPALDGADAPAGPATAGAVSAFVAVMTEGPAKLFRDGLLLADVNGATVGLATKE